jgi:hypothetical protein
MTAENASSDYLKFYGLIFEIALFFELVRMHLGQKKRQIENNEGAPDPALMREYESVDAMASLAGGMKTVFNGAHNAAIFAAGQTLSDETIDAMPLFSEGPAFLTFLMRKTDTWLNNRSVQWLDSGFLKTSYETAAKAAGQNHGYYYLIKNPDQRLALMRAHGGKALPALLSPTPKA